MNLALTGGRAVAGDVPPRHLLLDEILIVQMTLVEEDILRLNSRDEFGIVDRRILAHCGGKCAPRALQILLGFSLPGRMHKEEQAVFRQQLRLFCLITKCNQLSIFDFRECLDRI